MRNRKPPKIAKPFLDCILPEMEESRPFVSKQFIAQNDIVQQSAPDQNPVFIPGAQTQTSTFDSGIASN